MQNTNILNNVQAGRDVIVNGYNGQIKPLALCTNEELLDEEIHCLDLVREERSRRTGASLKGFLAGAFVALVAFGWIYIQGGPDLVSAVCGALGAIYALYNLSMGDVPTDFEMRQLGKLEEICMLLRERRVR